MEDITRVDRVGFGLGSAQTAILPKQGRGGKGGQAKSPQAEPPPGEDSPESLDKDHLDLEA
jgi:hypothetical protein